MSTASPLAVPEPWDLVAPEYVRELMPVFETFAWDALTRTGVTRGTRVVDVAAGPGTLALLAARAGARVTAVDFSPRMVAALREGAAAAKLEVETLLADGMALPFKDRSFDAGFSLFGLMFFPDRVRGFRELHRVLVPGGRAVVSSWVPMERSPEMNAVYLAFGALMGGSPRGGMMPLSDPASCQQEMAEGGFRDVAVHEVEARVEYSSTDRMLDMFVRSSAPMVLARKALGEKWDGLLHTLRERVLKELGSGAQRLTFTAYLTVGTRK